MINSYYQIEEIKNGFIVTIHETGDKIVRHFDAYDAALRYLGAHILNHVD